MTDRIAAAASGTPSSTSATGLWIALIAGLTVLGSFAFACAAPLAAIAALAALTMSRNDGLALVIVAWLANQVAGFLLLSYPHTADSYGWGLAIGLAGVLGYVAAVAAARFALPTALRIVVVFAAAFFAYQAGLAAYGFAVSYGGDAFSAAIVGEVLAINAVAYAGFLAVHRAAVALSLIKPAAQPTAHAAA